MNGSGIISEPNGLEAEVIYEFGNEKFSKLIGVEPKKKKKNNKLDMDNLDLANDPNANPFGEPKKRKKKKKKKEPLG